MQGWSQLIDTTAAALGIALGVAIAVAVALRRDNDLYQRLLQTPPAMQAALVFSQVDLRAKDAAANADPEVRAAKRKLLTSIASAQLSQIDNLVASLLPTFAG